MTQCCDSADLDLDPVSGPVISWGQNGAKESDELIQHVRLQAARPA